MPTLTVIPLSIPRSTARNVWVVAVVRFPVAMAVIRPLSSTVRRASPVSLEQSAWGATSAASSVPQVPSRSPIVFRKKKGGKKWLDDSRLIMSLFYKSVAKDFLTFAIIMAKVGCKGYG